MSKSNNFDNSSDFNNSKKMLVIHTCCAPCSSLPIVLFDNIEPFINIGLDISEVPNVLYYFYNPNIQPFEEYAIRRDELEKYAAAKNVELVVEEGTEAQWDNYVVGFESEKEGRLRCEKCFEMRLAQTFRYAQKINADYVATVMSISPHKKTEIINRIGKELESQFCNYEQTTKPIEFLCFNFKKNDGFLKSTQISREHNMYRQKYCGCKYSIRK